MSRRLSGIIMSSKPLEPKQTTSAVEMMGRISLSQEIILFTMFPFAMYSFPSGILYDVSLTISYRFGFSPLRMDETIL